MMTSTSRMQTERASGYLQRLCKHFAHKLDVTFTPTQGSIVFPMGNCTLQATEDSLTMAVSAGSESDLSRMEDVIGRHLERFAFREPPSLDWQRRTEAGS